MSTSMDQYQPPPMDMTQQGYPHHSIHGSVGPVIGVLALITILGVIAGVIGRLCSGRPFMGHGQYDVEGWAERKCSSCIDGTLDPPTLRRTRRGTACGEEMPVVMPVVMPVETPVEAKEEEREARREHSHVNTGNGE